MNRDVFVRTVAGVVMALGAAQGLGSYSYGPGRLGIPTTDQIEVDPNSGRSLEGLPLWSPDSIIVKFTSGVSEDVKASILLQNLLHDREIQQSNRALPCQDPAGRGARTDRCATRAL